MRKPSPKRVVSKHLRTKTAGRIKTAGEIRFVKDQSDKDVGPNWAYPGYKPHVERAIKKDFIFNAKELEPLSKSLRSGLMALGHATSCYNTFVKIKSRNISPDGNLGGLGYIMPISDIRKNLMNCIEALSSITDSMYDEILAPHWNPDEDELTPRDREHVINIVEQIKELHSDPEDYAEQEEQEMDAELDSPEEQVPTEEDYDYDGEDYE